MNVAIPHSFGGYVLRKQIFEMAGSSSSSSINEEILGIYKDLFSRFLLGNFLVTDGHGFMVWAFGIFFLIFVWTLRTEFGNLLESIFKKPKRKR